MPFFSKIKYNILGDKMKEDIINYIPLNEQEKSDKEVMLTYLENFDNCYTRDNILGHFTASCFFVNENRDKVLMAYHNIYKSFAWLGGHADGNTNLLEVSIKEAKEESSIKSLKLLDNNIFSLDVIPVKGHIKRGKYISAHMHLNVTYLFEASENDELAIKEDENSDVQWLEIAKLDELINEKDMLYYYHKFIDRMKKY